MTTFFYTHPACLEHEPGAGHPEAPVRLKAIVAEVERADLIGLERREAPQASRLQLARIHLHHQQVERLCEQPLPVTLDRRHEAPPFRPLLAAERTPRGCGRGRWPASIPASATGAGCFSGDGWRRRCRMWHRRGGRRAAAVSGRTFRSPPRGLPAGMPSPV